MNKDVKDKLQEVLDKSDNRIQAFTLNNNTIWICISTINKKGIQDFLEEIKSVLGVRKLTVRFVTTSNLVNLEVIGKTVIKRKFLNTKKQVRVKI